MRLGLTNRIVNDSDFNNFNRVNDRDFDIKSIYFRYKLIKIDLFQYKFELLIDLNRSNVDY